jgi:hypothetical protein
LDEETAGLEDGGGLVPELNLTIAPITERITIKTIIIIIIFVKLNEFFKKSNNPDFSLVELDSCVVFESIVVKISPIFFCIFPIVALTTIAAAISKQIV